MGNIEKMLKYTQDKNICLNNWCNKKKWFITKFIKESNVISFNNLESTSLDIVAAFILKYIHGYGYFTFNFGNA